VDSWWTLQALLLAVACALPKMGAVGHVRRAFGFKVAILALCKPWGVYPADAWQAVRSGWDGHVLVVAGVDNTAEAAAGSQCKALTPAQRAMAATKRWVRLTSPLRYVRYVVYSMASSR
jgi:hypothetical protein